MNNNLQRLYSTIAMTVFCVYLLLKILICVCVCAELEDLDEEEVELIDLIPEIYNGYLEAVKQNKNVVARRFTNNNNRYDLHISKLKEVNGIKAHNVLVTRTSENEESLIYINNPVESRIPNAFLTQEQFKTHIMNHIKRQQTEFEKQNLKKYLNMFKFKPKKKEIKKPFVWSLLKIPANTTKHQKANFIITSTKIVTDDDVEDLSTTTVPRQEIITDRSRDLLIAMLNGETLPTVKSSTNIAETTLRRISEDPIIENSESFNSAIGNYLNHTDPQASGENVTSEQQEELNATIGDVVTTTDDYDNTFTDNNDTPSTIAVTDTIVTETSKLTTAGTTKSTRTTRGRPFVFMN